MKKILLFVGAAALLFGCEAAAIKEVKATAYSNAESGVTIGDVFDKGLQNASWTSETDEAGVETVTVTGLFDWQNGGGLVETAFTFAKNADGVWEPVAVSAGGDTAGCGVSRRRYGRQCVFRRTGVSDGLRRLRRGGCVGSGRKSSRQNDSGRDRNFS